MPVVFRQPVLAAKPRLVARGFGLVDGIVRGLFTLLLAENSANGIQESNAGRNRDLTIESRADFAQWTIEQARAIVAEQGGNLAVAVCGGSDDSIADTANASGQAIVEALLDVFEGLIADA